MVFQEESKKDNKKYTNEQIFLRVEIKYLNIKGQKNNFILA